MNFTHLPLMLISYKAILPLSQLRNSHQYKTINYQLYLDFTIFPTYVPFLFQEPSQSSRHLSPQSFPAFHETEAFEAIWSVTVRNIPPHGSVRLSRDYTEVMHLRKNTTKVTHPPESGKSRDAASTSYDWAGGARLPVLTVSASFLYCKVTLLIFVNNKCLGRDTLRLCKRCPS